MILNETDKKKWIIRMSNHLKHYQRVYGGIAKEWVVAFNDVRAGKMSVNEFDVMLENYVATARDLMQVSDNLRNKASMWEQKPSKEQESEEALGFLYPMIP